nr:hypothetical protein [Nocardioidaceae bacterium]
AVIVPVAVVASQNGSSPQPTDLADQTSAPTSPAETPTAPSDPGGSVPDGWRVESYDGVQLKVPAHWGWGGVPGEAVSGQDGEFTCGQEGAFAYPGPDGETLFEEGAKVPYVGRAGYYMTDVCTNVLPPTDSYVWLGSAVEVGTVELANGFVQETVKVEGAHVVNVTVADTDAERRAMIIGSIETLGVDANGCDTDMPTPPSPPLTNEDLLAGVGDIESVSVCVYSWLDWMGRDTDTRLGYSTQMAGPAAQSVFDAIAQTPEYKGAICAVYTPGGDEVLLRFHGREGDVDVAADIYNSCGAGFRVGRQFRWFTEGNVRPWIVDGVGLYASGGQLGNAISGLYPMPWK